MTITMIKVKKRMCENCGVNEGVIYTTGRWLCFECDRILCDTVTEAGDGSETTKSVTFVCAMCGKSQYGINALIYDGKAVCEECFKLIATVDDKYQSLQRVLDDARKQAASGKGHERHASEQSFEDQPIMWIEEHFQSFDLGQAVKKMHESQRLNKDAAKQELLGAINYIAARILFLEKTQ